MAKTVSEKMRLRLGLRTIYLNAPTEAVHAIEALTMELEDELSGDFDHIYFFVRSHRRASADLSYLENPFETHRNVMGFLAQSQIRRH